MFQGLSQEAFVTLGKELADAHVPAKYDWRTKFRLPAEEASAESSECETSVAPASNQESAVSKGALTVVTVHGEVTISRIPDGRYALRNEKNDALIDLVKGACKGRARWNPRFRNWLIEESELSNVVRSLKQSAATSAPG